MLCTIDIRIGMIWCIKNTIIVVFSCRIFIIRFIIIRIVYILRCMIIGVVNRLIVISVCMTL